MEDARADRSRQSTTLVQVLSLYLLLLAFFVVLYNHSRVEDAKRKAVFGSLQATFADDGPRNVPPTILFELEGEALGAEAFKREFGDLVRTLIPVATVEIRKDGRQVEAVFPTDVIFDRDKPRVSPGGERVLGRIAEALASAPQGLRYDMSAQVGSTWLDTASLDKGVPLAVRRAGAAAKALEKRGAPAGTVAAGVDQGGEGFMTFSFYVRPAREQTLRFLPVETEPTP